MQIWLLSDMFNLVYIYIYMLLVGIPEGVIRMFQLSCALSTWKKDIEATVLLLIKKKKSLERQIYSKRFVNPQSTPNAVLPLKTQLSCKAAALFIQGNLS